MKKIKLLVVLAILVVGIQGCSTEETTENSIESAIADQQKIILTNGSGSDVTCWKKIYVRFPKNWGPEEHTAFFNYARDYMFEAVLYVISDNCETVKTWRVPCSDFHNRFTDDIEVVNAEAEMGNLPDDDEPVITDHETVQLVVPNLPGNMDNGQNSYYQTCDDVPPRL